MRKLGHSDALDGVRGIAILLVVAVHTAYYSPARHSWNGGVLGVDLFFVLSGFLITGLLLTEWDRHGSISLRGFYGRRARRLLPALVTLVGFFSLVTLGLAPALAPQILVDTILRLSYVVNLFAAFASNGIDLGFVHASVGHAFEHLWSLSQEEQFYLLWPICLVLLLRRRVQARSLLLVVGLAIVAINIQRFSVVLSGGSWWQRVWYSPDTHGDAILFGCAAGIVYCHRLVRVPRAVGLASLAVIVSIVVWFSGRHPIESALELPIFAAAAAIFLLAILDDPAWALSRLVSVRPLRATGEVSYGLYLWHVPLLVFFGLAGLPFAVLATLLSYRYIEKPIRPKRSHSRSGGQTLVPGSKVSQQTAAAASTTA